MHDATAAWYTKRIANPDSPDPSRVKAIAELSKPNLSPSTEEIAPVARLQKPRSDAPLQGQPTTADLLITYGRRKPRPRARPVPLVSAIGEEGPSTEGLNQSSSTIITASERANKRSRSRSPDQSPGRAVKRMKQDG